LNKIVSTKTTSAIFLAIVLVLGTIALTVPSFSVEAQTTSDREKDYDHDEEKDSYDKDRDDKSRDHDKDYDDDDDKSYGKDDKRDKFKKVSNNVNIKKVKCNNINVNLNGIDVNIGLPNNGPVTGPIAVAQEADDDDDDDDEIESNSIENDDDDDEIESNSIENDDDKSDEGRDGHSDSDTNSRIVCINNNNNIVVQEEPEPPVDECILCFKETTPELRDAINTFLDEQGDITVAPGIVIPADVNNFEQLCAWLADEAPLLLTQDQIDDLIAAFADATGEPIGDVTDLVNCLIDAGLIEVLPPEPPGQLTVCHRSASQPDQTLTGLSQGAFNAHINQHDGPPGAGPDSVGPCPT
jgi:hypothetical protein